MHHGLLDLRAPDHTTISRRNQDVLVPAVRRDHDGPIHLIVDSTGLKIYGAGEWCSRKHRKANERRGWRKRWIGSVVSRRSQLQGRP